MSNLNTKFNRNCSVFQYLFGFSDIYNLFYFALVVRSISPICYKPDEWFHFFFKLISVDLKSHLFENILMFSITLQVLL